MLRLGTGAGWSITIAIAALPALAAVWLGYPRLDQHVVKDYEGCAEEAQASSSSSLEYSKLMMHCGARFAGRRKAGGGYTYFDFMQNRTFEIAGPNPTEDERKKIDRSYMEFLSSQRREVLLSDLAKAQADQEQAAFERGQEAVTPLAKIPLPTKRPSLERLKPCEDGSLSCTWAKLSAAVKNAFASSDRTHR